MSRRSKRTKPAAKNDGRINNVGVCACGKRRYETRQDAKRMQRLVAPGDHFSEYLCPLEGNLYWHFGHTPNHVISGLSRRAATGRQV